MKTGLELQRGVVAGRVDACARECRAQTAAWRAPKVRNVVDQTTIAA